jgi:hypothetical protein
MGREPQDRSYQTEGRAAKASAAPKQVQVNTGNFMQHRSQSGFPQMKTSPVSQH